MVRGHKAMIQSVRPSVCLIRYEAWLHGMPVSAEAYRFAARYLSNTQTSHWTGQGPMSGWVQFSLDEMRWNSWAIRGRF